MTTKARSEVLRFGPFELEPETCELRGPKDLVRLQPQPCRVLTMLVSRPGKLVSREEIQKEIWGDQTFVDFEQGLNFCIRQIRSALGDTAGTPNYIETLPRRGYRFIASVDGTASFKSHSAPIALPLSSKVRLAVLPFENLSGETKHDYFADGMTDALITELAQISGLRVISRTSVMRFKGTRKPLPEIASELNVEAAVEGTVLPAENRVRVTAQLIDVPTDRYVWAESYERDLQEILTLQRKLARAIARGIRVRLTPHEQARLTTTRAVNPEVYQFYLKGRHYWNRRNEDGLKKAVACFEQAISLDPSYAPAYAGLADSLGLLAYYSHMAPHDAFPRAKAAVQRALEIDDDEAPAHTSLGYITQMYEWNWGLAEREFKRAIELNPSYATGHHWHATYLMMMGHLEQATEEIRRAQELDPLSLIINTTVGSILYCRRKHEMTIEQCHKTIELEASFPAPHCYLGRAYLEQQRFDEAIRELQISVQMSNRGPRYLEELAYGFGVASKKREAHGLLNELLGLSAKRYVSPYYVAMVYVGLNQVEKAFEWLERAISERAAELVWLKVDPRLDRVRQDSRFENMLNQVGLAYSGPERLPA